MNLNLLLGKWDLPNLFEYLRSLRSLQITLSETKVFKVSVNVKHICYVIDGQTCYWVVAEVKHFQCFG